MAPTFPTSSPINIALLGVGLATLYVVGTIFYRLFLHPLRSYPGPILWRISSIPRVYHLLNGDLPFVAAKHFAKYGSVVRVSPDELIYSDPQAWKDIYGHRTGGVPELPKHDRFYRSIPDFPVSVLSADRTEHGLIRRQLAHGFSDKAMREQEPIIGEYVDLLIKRLHENGKNGAVALNMREWFNWTTFDVIGDLGFGSSFGSLQTSAYHPWVRIITHNIKQTAIIQGALHLGFQWAIVKMHRWGLMKKNDEHIALVRNKLQERIKLGMERPDFIEGLIKKKDEWHMDLEKLVVNSSLLIIAGSETTATLLSGAAFLLTTHPDILAKLTQEVRSSFKSEDEITLTSVSNLHYMLACLNESLRRYPPVTGDLPRVSPKGGATVLGKFVPEGTALSVWQWPINHDPRFWNDPMAFAPERWMEDPKYKGDRLEAMQPFSVGPRNCIGRNLAYAEMRLILAKIIYNFDMTISDDCRNWLRDQKAFIVWEKPALDIYMTPVANKSG
ncbi:cytochrome P450 [Hypoxylon crocopeplum]|nr:cytochrome P450 [Hypoxylon crocopeplum]